VFTDHDIKEKDDKRKKCFKCLNNEEEETKVEALKDQEWICIAYEITD